MFGGLLAITFMMGGCTERKLGEMTLSEAYDDPRVIALIEAACRGEAGEIRRLLAAGVNANAQGKDDMRPLPWVMQCGDRVGLDVLLAAGADPNHLYRGRVSAIWMAAGMYDVKVLDALAKHGADLDRWEEAQTPLIRALDRGLETGAWENYYALLDAGADVNNASETGFTLMHSIIALGQFDKASELLDRGYNRDLPKAYSSALGRWVNEEMPHYQHKRAFLRKLDSMGISPNVTTERDQR